jgi:hypothetical protein
MLSAAAALIIVTIVATIFIVDSMSLQEKQPFYVGVTYCGDSVDEAKQLIDKVKGYTNLFILQSGSLQYDTEAINEIGDCATAAGLNFAVYLGVDEALQPTGWINSAQQKWGSQFLGIYYNDEPGGKMLDSYIRLSDYGDDVQIIKLGTGGLEVSWSNGTMITFTSDGRVRMDVEEQLEPDLNDGILYITDETGTTEITHVPKPPDNNLGIFDNGTVIQWFPIKKITQTNYYPNGTKTILELPDRTFYTVQNGSELIAKAEPYSSVLNRSPIKNYAEAEQVFTKRTNSTMAWLASQSVPVFTSDYALYWWDYKSGYDMVLAELGWNNTGAQEIGLVRGAANLQGKDWGTIITWKYTRAPYLASGEEVYEQMRTSYECGAKYVIIFNYAEDMSGPYGTLKDEHFEALKRFWNDVVQNPQVKHEGIEAEAVLVLPSNYGWGMRHQQDSIWGLWNTNQTSQQIWTQLQNKLQQHGTKLDIVYDDPQYPVTGKYSQIYYWNQTT